MANKKKIIGIIALLLAIFVFFKKKLNFSRRDLFVGDAGGGIGRICPVNEIKPEFIEVLNKINKEAVAKHNINLRERVTSGFRCLEYNRLLQRFGYNTNDQSSHVKGLAGDFKLNKEEALKIIEILKKYNVNRYFWYREPMHLHIDIDGQKTPAAYIQV
jgi:hypothetical protein